jgi:hypothetical protein
MAIQLGDDDEMVMHFAYRVVRARKVTRNMRNIRWAAENVAPTKENKNWRQQLIKKLHFISNLSLK